MIEGGRERRRRREGGGVGYLHANCIRFSLTESEP